MRKKIFCFGLGYTAQNLIQHLKKQKDGWQFSGTCRTLPENPIADVDIHIFDGNSPMKNMTALLSDVTHILISIAPQKGLGDPVLHHHHAEISNLKGLKWLGYLSTTGVYGDHKGAWVNDESAPAPTSAKGRQRLAAEQGWLKIYHGHHIPVHIFRLGSIYGSERGPLTTILTGNPRKIFKKGQYFSRIHVEDIARVLTASLNMPNPGRSYNVVDDMPASTPDVIDYICDLLNRPPIPATDINDADISPMMRMFYSENKRVRNDRIKQELGVTLAYPTYQKGYTALVHKSP